MSEITILQTDRQTDRQTNFELLRIVAMLLIVAHHFSAHSGFAFPVGELSINRFWVQLLAIGGKIGVDLFVLISGYFLVGQSSVRTAKVLKLWLQIFTYSLVITVVFMAAGAEAVSIKRIIKIFLPVTFPMNWFAGTYFVFYLISPFVGKLLRSMDKSEYQRSLVLTTVIWCLVPTLLKQSYQSNNLIWFIYLYAVAGYIRLHLRDDNVSVRAYLSACAAMIVLTFGSAVLFDILGTRISFFARNATHFYGAQTATILLISMLMFLGFKKLDMGRIRWINTIAATTFGVYLIHDNGLVWPFLWKTIFQCASHSESHLLIPYSLAVIALVFIACAIIEYARLRLLERHYMSAVDMWAKRIDKAKERFFSLAVWDRL